MESLEKTSVRFSKLQSFLLDLLLLNEKCLGSQN
jgi:hypothetical protein